MRWILACLLMFGCSTQIDSESPTDEIEEPLAKVCFAEDCFKTELALTQAEQAYGLMYRTELPRDQGMLFVFAKEDIFSFWMKNTYIPLDMVWLDANKTVVHISKNAQPCGKLHCPSIKPEHPAKYVFEINAGVADDIDLQVGDQARFDI